MYLGRHTCLAWLDAAPVAPWVIAVGDRRRVSRVLSFLDDAEDLAAAGVGRAAGRVALGVGRTGSAGVMVVETQMGGPATEIILREALDPGFHAGGARAVIRVGSCGTLANDGVAPDLVVAEFATGWSAAVEQKRHGVLVSPAELPTRPPAVPCSAAVVDALADAAGPAAARAGVFSKDSLYAEQDERFEAILRDLGCAATEMELATIGSVAEEYGVPWGGIMATAGSLGHEPWYDPARIARNEDRAIEAALAAIGELAAA
jgi:uridine phosphorylase